MNDLIYKITSEIGEKKARIIDEMCVTNIPKWKLKLAKFIGNKLVMQIFGYELEVKNNQRGDTCEARLLHHGKVIARRLLNIHFQ